MTEQEQDFTPETIREKSVRPFLKFGIFIVILVVGAAVILGLYVQHLNQPIDGVFPITVSIQEGDSVPEITQKFVASGVVQSDWFFYLILTTFFDTTKIKASLYVFDKPLSTIQVAEQIIQGDFNSDLSKVTIFEGESREKIAERLANEKDWFDPELFLSETSNLEGKLFPETYFIPKSFSTKKLVTLLNETYQEVIQEYSKQIEKNLLTEVEVVTLASIIEREGNTETSMKMIAGIFLNRLDISMPLQADASIEYVLERELNELAPGQLAESLREIDSPYNTYLYTGLPPTPIGNPGRIAIEAVLDPIKSENLYYITGDDGEFYYAETYNEHLRNIELHLR